MLQCMGSPQLATIPVVISPLMTKMGDGSCTAVEVVMFATR
jgi:hypothetical protein